MMSARSLAGAPGRSPSRGTRAAAAAGFGLALAVSAAAWAQAFQPARSSVGVTFRQMNVPVDANFKSFRAQVAFDPAKPAEGKGMVEIDVASLDLGDADYNAEVRRKAWFDTATHPKATFVVAGGAKPAGPNRFEVPGKLTIKGRTQDVVAPVIVRNEGNLQLFEGQVPIKRLAFNIGEGEWKDTSLVADEVVVKFRIATAR